ncbi:hypothetical protein SESBI_21128 [Sesbania bispinosa]|nr:hypothetical protein SESBI_21128 [Sesbania bispinosa]
MDGHSSTSQVRVLSSSSSNPNYDWVLPEVLEKPSEYLSVQFVKKFRYEYDIGIGNPRVESSIIVEPCLAEEFVCFRLKNVEDPDFTFVYDTFFVKPGLSFPLSGALRTAFSEASM